MPSTKRYLNMILKKLAFVPNVSYKEESEDFILLVDNTVFGMIYNDKFLVKMTKRSKDMIPYAVEVLVNDDVMLHMNELGNKFIIKELVLAVIKDINED